VKWFKNTIYFKPANNYLKNNPSFSSFLTFIVYLRISLSTEQIVPHPDNKVRNKRKLKIVLRIKIIKEFPQIIKGCSKKGTTSSTSNPEDYFFFRVESFKGR